MAETESYPYCMLRKSIAYAVDDVAKRLEIVPGAAIARLIEVLSTERIRAYWRGKYDGSCQLIEKHRWPGATIDIKNETVTVTDPVERMRLVDLDGREFETWLEGAAPAKNNQRAKEYAFAARRGRPAEFDWGAVKRQCFEVLEQNGTIDPGLDPAWKQANLEAALMDWCQNKWDRAPGNSTLREKLPEWLAEWEATR